ncbi:MAG: 30S ribosome-binding factor RbfA [Acidimicrobiales bacterium]
MAKKSQGRRPRQTTNRHYPRTARINALLQEIIGDYFERVDEDAIGFMTITGVDVDADLNICEVFISTFADESEDEATLSALAEHRKPVQSAIAKQAKLRKTPTVQFTFDPGVRAGIRIDEVLSTIDFSQSVDEVSDDEVGDDDTAPDDLAHD